MIVLLILMVISGALGGLGIGILLGWMACAYPSRGQLDRPAEWFVNRDADAY